ncbi:Threonyl/alanyl tRNA synthetase [Lipomyces tetrasporus]|uniref:Threonyl/alanyl tRNA synthetase n=1 Tax=Lipomyces tetrasporus TaxID=54092 RepID=A0AAD7VTL3_9ASCO|nr:Threonyl/alanyl tRNA synthetase [Lipomyces tetrasporus]KAJ8101096.1 Threonyl/alanyl tRNA synthetase [Lipomyces tetrasporus]
MAGSAVVGALACQVDSYLRSFETTVVSCRPIEIVHPSKPAKKSKLPAQSSDDIQESYEVELKDTILFPEGGGQPSDHGVIVTPESELPVLAIRRALLTALHKVPKPIEPNTAVKLEIDWRRRFDHMQQHSGQHLISAILDQLAVPTLAWSLGEKVSYVELPRKLTDEEVIEVENRCNDVIREGIDIWVEVPDKSLVNKDKLPDDYDAERGILRVVHIGNLDANPCCGTHLKNTREMGSIALLHQLPIRGSNSRLHFLIGDRVRAYARELNNLTRVLNSRLSCQTEEIEAKISRLDSQLRDSLKREKLWRADVVKSDAARIKEELKQDKKSYVYRADGAGLDYFNSLVAEIGHLEASSGVLVLASGAGKNGGALLVIGEGADRVASSLVGDGIIKSLKGGGKGAKWQGKISQWEKGEVEMLRDFFDRLEI